MAPARPCRSPGPRRPASRRSPRPCSALPCRGRRSARAWPSDPRGGPAPPVARAPPAAPGCAARQEGVPLVWEALAPRGVLRQPVALPEVLPEGRLPEEPQEARAAPGESPRLGASPRGAQQAPEAQPEGVLASGQPAEQPEGRGAAPLGSARREASAAGAPRPEVPRLAAAGRAAPRLRLELPPAAGRAGQPQPPGPRPAAEQALRPAGSRERP